MKLYDISLTLSSELPTWPGDPKIQIEQISSIEQGAQANVSHLAMGVHAGTHVDAPDHFLGNGKGVDQLPLDLLIGPATVVELPAGESITIDMLQEASIPSHTRRLLFKTRNSAYWAQGETEFQRDFMALDVEAADYLVRCGVDVVGVDYLSVAPFDQPVHTHTILLQAEILVIEGLDLSDINPGEYTLYCFPLKIADVDGAPARVVLGQ